MARWPLWAVALAKAAASAAVLAAGFRAVSDDDFSRVVIAEQWARAPQWDASRTSWLPFPFWIVGSTMKLAGRSLDTARLTAAALGVAAALVVYAAARWMGEERRAATAGAVVAAVFPWSARLGVATVPELFTAALSLLAAAALTPARGGGPRRLLGGAALVAATLSRYEAWPVAMIFAGVCAVAATRSRAERGANALAAALAVTGPALWLACNRAEHGDALHFLARVAAYRQALGAEGGAAVGLWAYPLAMVREEPGVVALFAAAAATTGLGDGMATLRARLSPYAWPAALTAAQIAALSLAMIKDGAPTHHPERAVLAALLLVALAGGALTVHAIGGGAGRRWRGMVIAAAVGVAVGLGHTGATSEGFAQRGDEEAIGRAAAAATSPGEPVLIEAGDYGYLAVSAAMERPEDAVPDRSVDPRDAKVPSSFDDAAALRQRLALAGARWAAARVAEPVRAAMGAPIATRGAWGLFKTEARP
jgi:Dolichyl-phosphate-mannose-protein mannosyltransferase